MEARPYEKRGGRIHAPIRRGDGGLERYLIYFGALCLKPGPVL